MFLVCCVIILVFALMATSSRQPQPPAPLLPRLTDYPCPECHEPMEAIRFSNGYDRLHCLKCGRYYTVQWETEDKVFYLEMIVK